MTPQIYIVQRRERFTSVWEPMPEPRAYQHISNAQMDAIRFNRLDGEKYDYRVTVFLIMDLEAAAA